MMKGNLPCPIPGCDVKSPSARNVAVWRMAVLRLALLIGGFLAMCCPLMADGTSPSPAPAGGEDFGQYLADHQGDLAPFFSSNLADFCEQAVPVVLGMLTWVIVITMVVGWAIDVGMSRGFAYFFAPAFAEMKRSVIYATGRLFLSFVYSGLLALAIVFSLKVTFGAVVLGVAFVVLMIVALAAQVVWILYMYRTNFAVSALFYLAIIVVHSIVFAVVAKPVIGMRSTSVASDFVDQVVTPRLKAEADSVKQQFDAADADRNAEKAKVTDLQNQVAQNQADADQLRKDIEAKKNSDIYVFSQIVQARARGDLADARDRLTAFIAQYPTSSVNALAHAQLAEVSSELSAQNEQEKEQAAAAAAAAAAAQADLLARAAAGNATLSEMRRALIGKSRTDVGKLLGLPTDTGSDTWGYRRQMIINPLTNEKHGLTVYFSEGTVQGVDYDRDVGSP